MHMKFLLGLSLVTALVIGNNCYASDEEADFSEAAGKSRTKRVVDYNGKKGETFETSFGSVFRSSATLTLSENEGEVHMVKKGGQLMFPKGTAIGGVTLKKRLLLSQAMTREQMVQALAAFME